jgi:hypothetical protein
MTLFLDPVSRPFETIDLFAYSTLAMPGGAQA